VTETVEPEDVWELGEPWDDERAEYQVLTDFLVPAQQRRFDRALQDWEAIDTKAFGMLAVVGAVVAGLVAVHKTINPLWWAPAIAALVAAGMMVAAWPRTLDLGADLVDLHHEMRDQDPLETARTLFNATLEAEGDADAILALKSALFRWSLVVLSLSLLACIPVVLFRP